ncbi:mersacidin/lichenicidin family type 2 lantibiotic [Archangium violaceum]|uniref:mersacidin/lichenicidin family type 2 lantibiotic n=1 Tax=Archangium violaceum TaxID=83451 RepID=UPI001951BB7D|nr:mersacidin/lichenicidin family type 2 lantibiotic [Archangium violaceum]QRO00732.1 mersacidin/lichenicidin family type 2 lantibiotic [Archangium violaceum]
MRAETIIRAWKDPAFRASLTSEERAALPELPSGKPMTELEEGELSDAVGGVRGRPRGCPPREFTDVPCSAIDACPSALLCTVAAC